jgi:hypothetical protein
MSGLTNTFQCKWVSFTAQTLIINPIELNSPQRGTNKAISESGTVDLHVESTLIFKSKTYKVLILMVLKSTLLP